MIDGTGVNEHLLIRGSSKTPGPEVPRRFLEAIAGDKPLVARRAGAGGSRWRVRWSGRTNPFASRVIVNRVWHHLFGRGIVATVDNFGVLGEPPSHPELLDHLADRFVRDGWSIKRLIRTLVLTRAYRMSSRPDARGGRGRPRQPAACTGCRSAGWKARRSATRSSPSRAGSTTGCPARACRVHLTAFMEGRGRPATSGPLDGDGRRSLYLAIRRNFLSPMMLAFDAPIPFTTIGRRNVSNVPAQALILMNDPFVVEQAALWADRVLAGPQESPSERVASMYRDRVRPAADARTRSATALDFLESQGRELGLADDAWKNDRRVWADLAHVLFNSKEFIYVD